MVDEGVSEPTELSVPPTVHALLAARLDRLDRGRARRRRGRIGGRHVVRRRCRPRAGWRRRPRRARPATRGARAQAADRAGRRTLRRARRPSASRTSCCATSPTRACSRTLRSDLHARYADWVEREAGERAGEYEEILGYHLERAYRYLTRSSGRSTSAAASCAARAAARLGSSGGRALARGDIRPAVSLLERAVSLLDDDDPARRDLSVKLGIALAETGQLSRAGELLHDRIQAERRGSAFVVFHDRAGKQHVVSLDRAGSGAQRRPARRQRHRAPLGRGGLAPPRAAAASAGGLGASSTTARATAPT